MTHAAQPGFVRPRVVMHPDEVPGVLDELLRLAGQHIIELVTPATPEDTARELEVPGSVLVSYRWRPDFLTDGLSWIQALGVGVNQFPLADLDARGIALCNARGVLADCVAEHAFACLLSMTRRVLESHEDQRAHRWVQRTGNELSQLTLGILGIGAIGTEIALRGKAFGMNVLGLRRTPGPVTGIDEVMPPERLDELCARSDVLIISLPASPQTMGVVGRDQLAALGPGWLVNVGRGGVVDEPALMRALREGELRGAALDVVDGEPLAADSALWDTPNLLLTGHSAALSPRWGHAWAELFEENLAAARGERDWASRVIGESSAGPTS